MKSEGDDCMDDELPGYFSFNDAEGPGSHPISDLRLSYESASAFLWETAERSLKAPPIAAVHSRFICVCRPCRGATRRVPMRMMLYFAAVALILSAAEV